MSQHTPGPWERTGGLIYIAQRGTIARVPSVKDKGVFEWLGNADLIAQAPALLRELKEVLVRIGDTGDWLTDDLASAHAVVAEAEGRKES